MYGISICKDKSVVVFIMEISILVRRHLYIETVRRQAIMRTNAVLLSIGPLRSDLDQIVIEIQTFSFKKMHLKMSS